MNISENDSIKGKIETIRIQIDRLATIGQKLIKIKNFDAQDYAGFGRIINIKKCSGNDNK